MIDIVKLQEDWWYKLMSEPALDRINVILLRKEVIEKRIDFSLLTKTSRNGRMGCGAVVEMPTFSVRDPSAPGPQGAFELTVMVAEMPTLNMSAMGGTLMSAEETCLRILDIGHGFFVEGVAEFAAGREAMEPAEFAAGHVAYRVRFSFLHGAVPTSRCAMPEATEADGLVSLSCATAGADIWYTTDLSFPGPANPAAVRYAAPFQVEAGATTIRMAAYKEAMTGSNVDRRTVTI